eukprot:164870_1
MALRPSKQHVTQSSPSKIKRVAKKYIGPAVSVMMEGRYPVSLATGANAEYNSYNSEIGPAVSTAFTMPTNAALDANLNRLINPDNDHDDLRSRGAHKDSPERDDPPPEEPNPIDCAATGMLWTLFGAALLAIAGFLCNCFKKNKAQVILQD